MKQKTPLAELIALLEARVAPSDRDNTYASFLKAGYEHAIMHAKSLLPKEREHYERAYTNGEKNKWGSENMYASASDYFNQNYEK